MFVVKACVTVFLCTAGFVSKNDALVCYACNSLRSPDCTLTNVSTQAMNLQSDEIKFPKEDLTSLAVVDLSPTFDCSVCAVS